MEGRKWKVGRGLRLIESPNDQPTTNQQTNKPTNQLITKKGGLMMRLPSLNIHSTHGQIGLKAHRPHLQIKQQSADLKISQQQSTMQISKSDSKLMIDQTEAFADANLKGPLRSSNEYTQKTKQTVMQYLSKKAHEGKQLLKIENGNGAYSQLAAQNSVLYGEREVNVALMPKPFNVKFQYQPSEIRINVSESKPNIQIQRREPTIEHRPWQTETYLRQKNNITIEAVGLQVNRQL